MNLFKRKKSVVGIDVGAKGTKVAQLQYQVSGKPSLERCDFIEIGIHDEEFEGKMKSYLKEAKIGGAMIASSIDDESMKIRKMDLPKMPDPDLIEAIKWNLRDIVDGDIEEFTVDFSRIAEIEEGENSKIELMAYAIKREAVNDYKIKLSSIGLHPFHIEPAAVTLASTLERCHGEDSGYIAGVNIGYSQTLFYVIGNGVFVFSRPLMGISLDTRLKEPDGFNQKLAIEIQKSIDTFKVNFKMQEIGSIFVSGGGALEGDIHEYLAANMGVEVSLLNPFLSLANTDAFEGVAAPLYTQAVGLAYLQP